MLARATVTSFKVGAAALLAFGFLFAASVWETAPGAGGFLLRELIGVLDDARTQWVIFLFSGVYFAVCVAVRMGAQCRAREAAVALRLARRDGACLWLVAVLGIGGASYFHHYSPSSQALMLMIGALLGQGVVAWAGWEARRQPAELRHDWWCRAVAILISLLALASVWPGDSAGGFAYQGRSRWAGPWGNPNIFGLLMAAGLVLSCGRAIHCVRHQPGRRPARAWGAALPGLCAAWLIVRGLFHSYSRGAWLGTLVALGYLCWTGTGLRRRLAGGWRNYFPLAVILVSVGALAFWHFRETEWHPARRAFSAANGVDFSWRNRLAAWEGALQITAEHPWFGAGWDQAEPLYENYYLPPKLCESLAIQMNDYLLFGATLGIPALLCFGLYLGLALTASSAAGGDDLEPYGAGRSPFDSVQATCRAGALVLLVGFWFDGGLFKLPTAATFWILLEMGGAGAPIGPGPAPASAPAPEAIMCRGRAGRRERSVVLPAACRGIAVHAPRPHAGVIGTLAG